MRHCNKCFQMYCSKCADNKLITCYICYYRSACIGCQDTFKMCSLCGVPFCGNKECCSTKFPSWCKNCEDPECNPLISMLMAEQPSFDENFKNAGIDPGAAFKVSVCYSNGTGVDQSLVKAMYWLRKCLTLKEKIKGANISDELENMEKLFRVVTSCCANCFAKSGVEGIKLNACTGCKATYYCSKQCQSIHWKKGGHKEACQNKESK